MRPRFACAGAGTRAPGTMLDGGLIEEAPGPRAGKSPRRSAGGGPTTAEKVNRLKRRAGAGDGLLWLLMGVTGGGKTEVCHSDRRGVGARRRKLVLVPESPTPAARSARALSRDSSSITQRS
jgi:hypothetical protein